MLSMLAVGVVAAAERPRLVGVRRLAVTAAVDAAGGLSPGDVQSAVETRLREAGVQIDRKSRNRLKLTIGVSEIQAGGDAELGYAYSIHLGLSQQVYLANNPAALIDAITWEGVWLGLASRGNLETKCEQSIARRLDEFIAVYQAGLADDPPTSRASARR